jgi:hypothetical protein
MTKNTDLKVDDVLMDLPESDIEIKSNTENAWAQIADRLPEQVTIKGIKYECASLNGKARKLLAIYLSDNVLVAQQREMLALAELGLKYLEKEIIQSIVNH